MENMPDSPPESARATEFKPEIDIEEIRPKSVKSEHSARSVHSSPEIREPVLSENVDSVAISRAQFIRMMTEINMLKQNQMMKEVENVNATKEKEVRFKNYKKNMTFEVNY